MAPEIDFINPESGQRLSGEQEIVIEVEGALSVDFYIIRHGSSKRIYLGRGGKRGDKQWSYLWNTALTPNSEYQIFAEVVNQHGSYQSQKNKIIVDNIRGDIPGRQEIVEELDNINRRIKEGREKVRQKIDQTQKQIGGDVSDLIEEAKEEIQEGLEELEIEVEDKQAEVRERVAEKLEELAENIQEERRLAKEIDRNRGNRKESMRRTKEEKEELDELERFGLPDVTENKVRRIKEEKEMVIKGRREKEQKMEEKIEEREERLSRVKIEREEKREEVIEESLRPVEIIKKEVDDPTKILKLEIETRGRIEGEIHKMEKEIIEEAELKVALGRERLRDSDNDGLPDFIELKIDTDPLNPDSDGDGHLDGEEVAVGADPLEVTAEERIIHQDPREVEPKREDIFIVKRAEVKVSEVTQRKVLRIEGIGLPNVFVTIHIFSLPIVVVTKTDAHGRWVYELDRPLEDGEHEIYVVLTNNRGEITARSEAFNFVKSGAHILRLIPGAWAKEIGRAEEAPASPYDILRRSFVILTLAIIILALGVALLAIGFLSKKKERVYFPSQQEIFSSKK